MTGSGEEWGRRLPLPSASLGETMLSIGQLKKITAVLAFLLYVYVMRMILQVGDWLAAIFLSVCLVVLYIFLFFGESSHDLS